jgi:peptidase, S41 family
MKRIAFLLLCCYALIGVQAQNKNHNFNVAKNIDVFTNIYQSLDMMYVDTLDANQVIGNGIEAMLNSLDPYTVYYTQEKEEELSTMITGKYAGIGALIKYNNQIKNVVIDQPYANTPSALAGLQKGDIILAIDNLSMAGKDNGFVSNHLRGTAGTTFQLKVKRPVSGKVFTVKITRKSIQLPAVPYYGMRPNNIAYINLSSFTEGCSSDVRKAFIELREKGAKGLVLDLRDNGGGSLSEAVKIVNMFVPKGITLVKTKGKIARANSEYKTTEEPIDTVMPIVVLVNENTASASEITAGSLQDLDRGVVLGAKTFGKGLVQQVVQVPYGGSLKLTSGKYYIPSGRCIQALKYKHAKGGRAEALPDSLVKTFYTLNKREVKDGGGIMPDVKVKGDSVPNIALYLASFRDSNEVMFNYELDYIAKHASIASPETFHLTDADYEEFKQRVIKSGFKYDGETAKLLKSLEQLARFEGYYDLSKEQFNALKDKLQHNVAHDLEYNKAFIKELLEGDIVRAYYYQGGGIAYSLTKDVFFKRATELLTNIKEYNSILKK